MNAFKMITFFPSGPTCMGEGWRASQRPMSGALVQKRKEDYCALTVVSLGKKSVSQCGHYKKNYE
jgi:hypothetical protein